MSGGLMLNKINCGCVYQAFRDHYGNYNKDSISQFIICKSCNEEEKNLTDDEVDSKISDVIQSLKTKIEENEKDGGCNDNWFSASGNFSLCFY